MTTETHKKTQFITVRVSEEELAWLKEHAAADDRSVHYVIRRALREYLEAHS